MAASGMLWPTAAGATSASTRRPALLRAGSAPPAPPVTGAYFGAAVGAGSGTLGSAVVTLQGQVGRRLDLYRIYDSWDTPQPSPVVNWAATNGYLPFVNIDAHTTKGQSVAWSQIASGADDATIDAQAHGLQKTGVPVLLSFDREPENDAHNVGAASYIAAFDHYVTVFRSLGVTNVAFAFVSGASAFASGVAASYYPGDAYTDWIGADGYNTYGCTGGTHVTWQSFGHIFAAFYSYGSAHNKPLIVAEWASTEDPNTPGRKAQWIADAASTMQTWPNVKAESYIDAAGGHSTTCEYPVTSSASAQTAMQQLGADLYFNPKPQAGLGANPTSGSAPLRVTLATSGTTSPASSITAWSLDFGDGSAVQTGTGNPPASVGHQYRKGAFTATLTVNASDGESDFATVKIDPA